MAHNERFIHWLQDAHALESSIIQMLESQVDLASDHSDVQSRIQQHLDETRRHAEIVEGCLESLGEDTSSLKDVGASAGAKVDSMILGAAKDDLVKAALADYATEYLEIASYKALILAANELGHGDIAQKLQPVLEEEQAMAQWLEDNTPTLIREALSRGET